MRRRYDAAAYRLTPERSLERMDALNSRVESLSASAAREADHALAASRSRLGAASPRADRAVAASLAKARGDLESLSKRMDGLNPRNVLGRGYAMVTSGGIEEGDDLVVHLRDGTLGTKVTKKEMKG
jgi:exodeoxyribonuclease VII large subunit